MDLVTTDSIDDGRSILIAVHGELDLATHGELASVAVEPLFSRRPVVLDLTGCSFIDSTGLREVLQVSRGLRENGQGSPVAIVAAPGSLPADLFALSGLDTHLNLFGTVEEARGWLEANGTAGTDGSGDAPAPAP